MDRLTRASPDQSLQSLGLPTEMYSYDAVGNRVSSAHQPGSWSYNQDNQMVRYPGKTLFNQSPAIDTQVTYTAQGYTQKESGSQGDKTYSYNAAERLVKYESSQGTQAAYRYDPFGRRISKHVTQGSSPGQITYFVYAEQALMGELDKEGRLARVYGFNPIAGQKGLWSTDPIWQAEINNASLVDGKTSYHYLHTDHLGTPVVAADKIGTVTWKSIAQAFGATEAIENSVQVNLRFPGQYFDSETGSHYNFRRDYSASVGRYIQSDPIGLIGGINTYAYADGAPVMFTDPTGEFINLPGIAIGVGLEVAMQAYKNYSDGCDLLDIDNYDLWNIGVAGAVGAFAPGMGSAAKGLWPKWMPFVGKSRGPGGAIKELWGQLDRANTANRVAKVASRIEKNGMVVADNLTYNAAYQAGKKAISNGSGNRDCTCQR